MRELRLMERNALISYNERMKVLTSSFPIATELGKFIQHNDCIIVIYN